MPLIPRCRPDPRRDVPEPASGPPPAHPPHPAPRGEGEQPDQAQGRNQRRRQRLCCIPGNGELSARVDEDQGAGELAEDGPDDSLRRTTDWLSEVTIGPDLPAPLLDQQGGVVDLTDGLEALERLIEPPPEIDHPATTTASSLVDETITLPTTTEDLASSLHRPGGPWQELLDLPEARRQTERYRPPGTGNTFLAQIILADPSTENH